MEKPKIFIQKEVDMDTLMLVWLSLIGVIPGLLIGLIITNKCIVIPLKTKVTKLTTQNEALRTIKNKDTKRLDPSTIPYPYSAENFRFIGGPIDGIQFEDEHIVFIAFKTPKSRLSPQQERIKQLVKNKKLDWFEYIVK